MKAAFLMALTLSTMGAQAALVQANCNFGGMGGIMADQRLPEGDRMRVTFTGGTGTGPGRTGTSDPTIVMPNGDEANCVGTVTPGSEGLRFHSPRVINGVIVTDMHQTHTNPNVDSGTLELAAFGANASGVVEQLALGDWLVANGHVGANALTVPDFIRKDVNLYYGVDLSIWAAAGQLIDDSALGLLVAITNGQSSLFPGFSFSLDPLTSGAGGWTTSTPFSGAVTLDSYHRLSVVLDVPEPGALALVALAGLALALVGRRRSGLRQLAASAPGGRWPGLR